MKAIMTSILILSCLGSVALAAEGSDPDWDAVSEMSTVEVLTVDEDGSQRVTTVWLIVYEGEAIVRTGGSRWGSNVVRDGELTLRIDEVDYAMTVIFEEDDARRQEIKQAFREKYGWFDGMVSWIRGDRPKHMRLDSKQ